jgi:hypothetical protein
MYAKPRECCQFEGFEFIAMLGDSNLTWASVSWDEQTSKLDNEHPALSVPIAPGETQAQASYS